jgi:ATP adenylyltransferase
MEQLFTPWRHAYITATSAEGSGCFFCAAARQPGDLDGLVVHTGRHHLVMLNLHPYSNGHLMVAPLEHLASPQENPHGFNLGMNVGSSAGAGVPGHFHFHLVPRWTGDTNFMTVLAEVRLIPEDLRQSRERLRALFARKED